MQKLAPGSSGGMRAADARGRQRSLYSLDREIVELEVFLRSCFPIKNIRLIPNFPAPLRHFGGAVSLHAMFGPLKAKLTPLEVILRRIAEAQTRAYHFIGRRIVWVILRMRRESFGHKTDLDERFEIERPVGVKNAIDDFPVVDRRSVLVLAINAGRPPF